MGMSERTVLGAYHPNALEMLQVSILRNAMFVVHCLETRNVYVYEYSKKQHGAAHAHATAYIRYQVTSNLRKVITDLVDLSKRVENSDVHVGRPIRPMLAR